MLSTGAAREFSGERLRSYRCLEMNDFLKSYILRRWYTHKFCFVIHMEIIKDQRSGPKMAWGPSYEIFITKNLHCW